MKFLVSLKFGISLVVTLKDMSMIFLQQRHKHGTRKILRASRRPGIVIKFWCEIVRDADPRHDVTKSRRRERIRWFVSSLIFANQLGFLDVERGKFLIAYFCQNLFYPLLPNINAASAKVEGPSTWSLPPASTSVGRRVRWRLRPKCQPRARDASGDGQLFLSLRQLWSHYQHQKDQRNVSASSRKPVSRAADIAGFHMTSLKLSWDFTFMIYKSSSKLLFRQIFAPNGFLVFYAFGWRGIYMPGERAVMLVKTVTYFGEFGYLNSSCIRTSIILKFFSFPRDTSRFCSKTQWQMFLLVSGRHVGAHPDGHQYGSLHTNLNKLA